MQPMYYIGLDVHKRKISYCVKDGSGRIHAEGSISATRLELDHWMRSLPQPWSAAMEATMFTGWIYDHLQPHAATLKVAHPLMLRAVAKKKNYRIDASKICDCLRCDFFAGEPYGFDGDSRTAAHAALSQPAGAPDGADENQDQCAADGSRSELQQAAATQGRLLSRTAGHEPLIVICGFVAWVAPARSQSQALFFHSYRIAIVGSSRIARRAGKSVAAKAATRINTETTANVVGSLDLTP
jgi:hypothetical protein